MSGQESKEGVEASKEERDEAFRQAVFKELDELRKQNAMLAEATAKLAEKLASLPSPEEQGQGKLGLKGLDPITALILRGLIGEEKKTDPVKLFAENTENLSRIAVALDKVRSPPDYEGLLAKRLLWKQGLRASATPGLPRYMTKEELKRYDKLLDKSLGIEEEEGEGEEHDHLS